MNFSSRKDLLFSFVIIGTSITLVAITITGIIKGKIHTGEFLMPLLMLLVAGFLLWSFFSTSYELTESDLIYRSGPTKGKIKLEKITEVIKDQTLWVGLRFATARKGLIIKYNKHSEIYISPKTNEVFIKKLLEFKSDIKVSDWS